MGFLKIYWIKSLIQSIKNQVWSTIFPIFQPAKAGFVWNSDRGSQYASHAYRKQLEGYEMISSMSGKGNCYDNAVVERFFGSLKHEWFINVIHLTREGMIKNVNDYIRFYNGTRLHSTLGYKTPNEYEILKLMCVIKPT